MRITNSTLTSNFLRNISRNLKQMQKYQNQLSSGKEVSKPSDNPMLVSKIMDLNNNIMQNEQYSTNIDDTIGWVETQDTALGGVTATLQRVRELIVYGANGSLADTDRAAIKDEVAMQIDQLADVLNTNFDGRYIFGGQKTTTPPFKVEVGVLTYSGDPNNISREISKGVSVNLITNGTAITGGTVVAGETNPIDTDLGILMKDIVAAMETGGDVDSLSEKLLGDIDQHLDNVIRVRSKVGAIYNRLEASQARNETENINLKSLLSKREDIDIAEKYMEYSVMSTVYQASLSTGAKVLQPSLLDYLR